MLHDPRLVLLESRLSPGGFDLALWADPFQLIGGNTSVRGSCRYSATSRLPLTVLVRSDGHAAWVGDRKPAGVPWRR